MVGGIIPLRRATSSRYDGRLEQESAFGVDTVSNKLYWDGKEIALRGVRLDWFERILAICVAVGTLGLFILELCKALWPMLVRVAA